MLHPITISKVRLNTTLQGDVVHLGFEVFEELSEVSAKIFSFDDRIERRVGLSDRRASAKDSRFGRTASSGFAGCLHGRASCIAAWDLCYADSRFDVVASADQRRGKAGFA